MVTYVAVAPGQKWDYPLQDAVVRIQSLEEHTASMAGCAKKINRLIIVGDLFPVGRALRAGDFPNVEATAQIVINADRGAELTPRMLAVFPRATCFAPVGRWVPERTWEFVQSDLVKVILHADENLKSQTHVFTLAEDGSLRAEAYSCQEKRIAVSRTRVECGTDAFQFKFMDEQINWTPESQRALNQCLIAFKKCGAQHIGLCTVLNKLSDSKRDHVELFSDREVFKLIAEIVLDPTKKCTAREARILLHPTLLERYTEILDVICVGSTLVERSLDEIFSGADTYGEVDVRRQDLAELYAQSWNTMGPFENTVRRYLIENIEQTKRQIACVDQLLRDLEIVHDREQGGPLLDALLLHFSEDREYYSPPGIDYSDWIKYKMKKLKDGLEDLRALHTARDLNGVKNLVANNKTSYHSLQVDLYKKLAYLKRESVRLITSQPAFFEALGRAHKKVKARPDSDDALIDLAMGQKVLAYVVARRS